MKRTGYLIEQVADMDNLRLAFYQSQRGKNDKDEVIAYRARLEQNLLQLRADLLRGAVEVGDYHLFKIYDPKERTVCAAVFRERVLHHALMNICAPYFERHFIETTYANRVGKGVYKALERAFAATNHYRYVAKLDVRKYFDNIDHKVLGDQLHRLFKDKRLLSVLESIIHSYSVRQGKGAPIGNLTSQFFANFYLSWLDHYAKEMLHAEEYVRYMDDILLFGNDRMQLKKQVERLVDVVREHLLLELKPPIIHSTIQPTAFLGYRIGNHKIQLTQRSKERFERKYGAVHKALERGEWGERQAQEHILPLFAFVQHAYSKRYRTTIINKVTSRRALTA